MNNSDVSFSLCFFLPFYYKQFIFIQHMSIKIDTDALLTNKTDHFIIALFVFLLVELLGLNKFGLTCHQRNWVIIRKRQLTQFAGN